jgi:hypothetical protein
MTNTTTININTSTINAAISGDFSGIISTGSTGSNIGQYNLNLANTVISGVSIVERTPPKDPYSGPFDFAGFGFGLPSTPRTARGVIEGTVINQTNASLSHGCMIFADFGALLGGGLTAEIQALLALPPARIQMSAQLRLQFSAIMQELRAAIDAILEAVGFDPTGIVSYAFSQAKAILRMVNYWLKDIKQLISDVQSIIMFVNQLFGIIQYLLSLPAQLLAIVQGCISSFLGSVMSITKSFENIPSTLTNQVNGAFNGITNFASSSLTTINNKANTYKQNNPHYQNISAGTITTQQIQTLIANVSTTDANTYAGAANTTSSNTVVQQSQNPVPYVTGQLFKSTRKYTVVAGAISYDTVYANNIYANTISCNNIWVNQNSTIDAAWINILYANTITSISTYSVPTVSGAGVSKPVAYPSSLGNDIAYGTIYADQINANNIVCDNLVCNSSISVLNTANIRYVSSVSLNTNSIIIIP